MVREGRRATFGIMGVIGVLAFALIAVAVTMAWRERVTNGDETATGAGPDTTLATDAEASAGDGDEDGDAVHTDDGENGADHADDETADDETADDEMADDETAEAADDAAEAAADLPPPPDGSPYVDATLTDNVFVLSGVVPNEEIKAALEAQAELAYAPFATSELTVDESVGSAEWLATAPQVVGLLPMITDGTIRLQDDEVMLAGRAPRADWVAFFEQTIGDLTGLPVASTDIEVTNLAPPRFVATVENGQVNLEGEIPSETLLQTFIQGAGAVYGPENVTSSMTVDEGTYTSFWNYTMPGVFQLLSPFPAYRIQVEDGVTSGSMQGGVLFDLNSTEITPDSASVLSIGVALLARDRSLTMTVIGHTDDSGPAEINERLSLARAQSVVDFMVAAGIEPERLSAEGRGEAEPLTSNETVEGRAINRRVEFVFG